MPVTIGIILNGSQLDAGFLIQAERNKKVLTKIQKKMMCTRSTLNWSQSNIFLVTLYTRSHVRFFSLFAKGTMGPLWPNALSGATDNWGR